MRILLALCTGLRKTDIDKLRVTDFDLSRKCISAKNKKTGKITLYQPLPDAVIPEIKAFIAAHVRPDQKKFLRYNWSKKWYSILEKAKLKKPNEKPIIEFHDLRRTFGSMQADAGVPIKALQEMFNHSNIETTMKHYIRTNDSVKRDGVNKLSVKDWLA